MTRVWAAVAVAGCLAATYFCFRLSVHIIMWRFRQ
jgi:hypothetical protein